MNHPKNLGGLSPRELETRRKFIDWVAFLKVMVEDEKAAIEKYQIAIEKAESKELVKMLKQLRDEEDIHIDLLEGEIARLEAN